MSYSLWAAGRYESVAERIATIAGETVADVERRHPLRGATLVDLACGTGSAALAAAARGALVMGVDVTPELIDIGEKKARSGYSPDQWGDPTIAARRLADDFTDVDIRDGMFTREFASLDVALHFLVHESPMHVDVFRRIDGTQRERLAGAFREALTPHADDDGVRFDTP